ncbi:MAG: MmpS family transport accessory protein [Janthinobacterium lividum]
MKRLTYLLLCCAALAAASCSKDNETSPSTFVQPKDYQVEYRVSSTSDPIAKHISYTNATGGTTDLDNVPLPASYSFTRNMKQGDNSLLLANIPAGGTAASNITVSILLDGKEVKKETGTGTTAQAVPVWVIGQ